MEKYLPKAVAAGQILFGLLYLAERFMYYFRTGISKEIDLGYYIFGAILVILLSFSFILSGIQFLQKNNIQNKRQLSFFLGIIFAVLLSSRTGSLEEYVGPLAIIIPISAGFGISLAFYSYLLKIEQVAGGDAAR